MQKLRHSSSMVNLFSNFLCLGIDKKTNLMKPEFHELKCNRRQIG